MGFAHELLFVDNFTHQSFFDSLKLSDENLKQTFEFEHYKRLPDILEFLESSWYIALLVGAAYVGGVFYLQHYMKHRKPFELKGTLVAWNTLIGIFSLFGCWRTAPELLSVINKPNGLYESICQP